MSLRNDLSTLLAKYERILAKLDRLKERETKQAAPGRLEVLRPSACGYHYVYTWKDPLTGKRQRKYLSDGKAENHLASRLAQAAYQAELRKLLEQRIPQLQDLLANFEDQELEKVYCDLHPGRQCIVSPIEPTRDQCLRQWQGTPYKGLNMAPQDGYFETNKGEKVRSKSEKILADRFCDLGIAYKYECPLISRGRTTLYPDFTFFDPAHNWEFYWEHFGMMDNPAYAKRACQKLEEYGMQGIFPGDRLIVTFETANKPLSIGYVNQLIAHTFDRSADN